MDSRISVATLAVAGLLLLLIPYPATFSTLGETPLRYEHRVDPAGTEAYQDRLEAIDDDADVSETDLRTVRYENLSPTGQAIFDRTLAAEQSNRGAHEYTPRVCRPGVIACPHRSRAELVPEFSYGMGDPQSDAALIVETRDGRYLFTTEAPFRSGEAGVIWIFPLLVKGTILVPAAVLLAGFEMRAARIVRATATVTSFALVATLPVLYGASVLASVVAALACAIGVATVRPRFGPRSTGAALALGCGLVLIAVGVPYFAAYAGAPGEEGVWISETLIGIGGVLSWGSGPALILASRYGSRSPPAAEDETVRSARK